MDASKVVVLLKYHRVNITYSNWRGETKKVNIVPIGIEYDQLSYSNGFVYILVAIDLNNKANKNQINKYSVESISEYEVNQDDLIN